MNGGDYENAGRFGIVRYLEMLSTNTDQKMTRLIICSKH